MSIEYVPPALVPRASEVPQTVSKPKLDSAAANKDPDGFSAVLNGMDKEADAPQTDDASNTSDVDSAAKGQARKKPSASAKPATDAAVTPDAAALLAASQAANAGLALVPTSDQGDASDALPGEIPLVGAAAGSATAATNGVAGLQALTPDARSHSVNLANYASVFEQIQSRLAAGGGTADTGQQEAGVAGAGAKGNGKPVLGTAAADMRADRLASFTASGTWTMPVTEPSALQAVTDAAEALKLSMSEKHEGVGSNVEKAPEGLSGQHQFTATVHFESATATVDVSKAAPEAAVADQVSYWISQGIQNAELTFSGSDARPVEVSISLSGNEAHVEFRTDQADTRDFLAGAASHLKDLLQSQGMVLSGLSVGSSGAGNAGARERRPAPEARQNTVRSTTEELAIRPAAQTRVSGRAVDLFV